MQNNRLVKFIISLSLVVSVLFVPTIPAFAAQNEVEAELNEEAFPSDTYLIDRKDYNVAPGVYETQFVSDNAEGTRQNLGYALTVDMSQATVIASYKDQGMGGYGMQSVRDQAYAAEQKRNVNVVAGVNADIFNMDTGEPIGYLIMDGVKYSDCGSGVPAYFAILKDGTPVIRDKSVPTDDVKEAVGVWSIIVKDGINQLGAGSGYTKDSEPRTCLGIKADGSVVLLVVDGRQAPTSTGVSWAETADFLISLGCVTAGELDGGGSTTFVSQHEGSEELVLRNSPSDGFERPVSSALMVVSNYKSSNTFDRAVITSDKDFAEPRSNVQFTAAGADSSGAGAPLPADGYFAISDESFGSVTKDGKFISNGKKGTFTVNYTNGAKIYGSKQFAVDTPDYNSPGYTGLVKTSDGKITFKLKGKDLKSTWRGVGSDIYYFDRNGNAAVGKYKITQSLKAQRPDVRDILYNGVPVSLEYTFGNDGKLIKGALVNKNNATYYIIGGIIQFGWHYYDGAYHFFDGVKNEAYYGKMLKGSWTRNYTCYTCDSSGRLTQGFVYVETDTNMKYQLFAGKMKYMWAGKIMTGWQDVNGKTFAVNGKTAQTLKGRYYFDYNNCGYLATDTASINGETVYFNSNGTSRNGLYNDGNGELLLKDAYKLYGWQNVNGKNVYFDKDNNGYKATNSAVIDGKTVYFNTDGTVKNGLITDEHGTMYFVDGEKITGQATVNGKIYYFDPDNNGYNDDKKVDEALTVLQKVINFIKSYLVKVNEILKALRVTVG